VLIVDDVEVNRRVALAQARRLGCEPVAVASGAEALVLLRERGFDAFDLVLMDLDMPDMDGLAATRAIRAEASAAGSQVLPIFALTANSTACAEGVCFAAGIDGMIYKPTRLADLERGLAQAACLLGERLAAP
jgi:CheY-like chemotaxis protein